MVTKELKQYQEKAVSKLLLRTKELLNERFDKKTLVFQAPTGSGKTFMMSQYIELLIEELEDEDLCFLWISIGKGSLHTQSYDSLKKEFQGFPPCYLLEQEFFGSKKSIEKNEVVVVNWEKLRNKDKQTGEWTNTLMKDKETVNFRELIRNTKDEGKKIIMIIDESHSNSTSERAIELRDDIVNADLTIEMSATPALREGQYNEKVRVDPNDVIDEGMIKKEIIINEDIDKISDNEMSSQDLIMENAFQKRLELKEHYKQEGLDINPLVLIQLPISEAGEDKKEAVEIFLAQKGITKDNGKLAVWLTEEKINNEKGIVIPNESEVEFLIFKQAIDTGWDCPRAQILVRFREIKSITFEIQTVGRILRMPEAKHYTNDNLNKGFIYTNIQKFDVKKEEYNPNIIKSARVKRKDIYQNIKLRSYYRNRIDYGDITSSFYDVLDTVLCDFFGIKKNKFDKVGVFDDNRVKIQSKINIDNLDNKDEIILNHEIDARLFDDLPNKKVESLETFQTHLSQDDLGHVFNNLIRINLNGFAPKRSIPTVKQALYGWFRRYINLTLTGNGVIYIQNICLNNGKVFSELFDNAVNQYKPIKDKELKAKIEETEEFNNSWEIEEHRNYNPYVYTKHDNYKLSLYEPCYLKINNVEKDFIEYLEQNSDKVLWWWQNGSEHMAINFGIKYEKYNMSSTFQPDFLVMLKNGKLGIFDTKASGDREDDNEIKNKALQQYLREENQKGKNLFGGLIIKEGQHFRIYSKLEYQSFKENKDNWDYFNL